MNDDEARAIAEQLVSGVNMRGFTPKFADVTAAPRFPSEKSVLFDVYSSAGNLVDGPMVVIVDVASKEARLMEGP